MRHAKSSWDDTTLPDSKRPLNKRGKNDAPVMGARLKAKRYRCDQIISSPAVRALETAKAVAQALHFEGEIAIDERLYMANIEAYLEVIAGVDDAVDHLMIVSHNPGTEAFFTYLTGESLEKFPTAAYALIEVDEAWSQLRRGRLIRFDYPKSER